MPSSDTQFKKGDKTNKVHPIFGKKNGSWKHGRATADNVKEYIRKYNKENKDYFKKYGKEYGKKNPEKIRGYQLLKNYGLTVERYNQMVEEQNGVCLICKQKSDSKKLSVDHNHETGEIRGLLCQGCNIGLGMFKNNVLILSEAIKYLNK